MFLWLNEQIVKAHCFTVTKLFNVFLPSFQGYHFRNDRTDSSHVQPDRPVDLSFSHCTHCDLSDPRYIPQRHFYLYSKTLNALMQ